MVAIAIHLPSTGFLSFNVRNNFLNAHTPRLFGQHTSGYFMVKNFGLGSTFVVPSLTTPKNETKKNKKRKGRERYRLKSRVMLTAKQSLHCASGIIMSTGTHHWRRVSYSVHVVSRAIGILFLQRGIHLVTIAKLLGHHASLGQDLGQANEIAYLTNSHDFRDGGSHNKVAISAATWEAVHQQGNQELHEKQALPSLYRL